MKRVTGILLSIFLLFIWTGCEKKEAAYNSANFYYLTASLSYESGSKVIAMEERQLQEMESWAQVLNLYLQGPEDSAFRSPFPKNLQIIKTVMENGTLYLTVSEELATLTGLDLTLACSCLALTCLDLAGAETVIVSAENALLDGQKSITMNKNTLLLSDTVEGE